MKRWILLLAILAASGRAVPSDDASGSCDDAEIFGSTLITGICWTCMFPMYIAGSQAFPGDNDRPSDANTSATCVCDTNGIPTVGYTLGLWYPSRLLEATKRGGCFAALGGADLGGDTGLQKLSAGGAGQVLGASGNQENNSFYHWHVYSFPILEMLSLINIPTCAPDNYTSFDVLWVSEMFPNWDDPVLAATMNPEASLFIGPVAQAAGAADCVAATASGPIDDLFWKMGCWGSTYPLNGKIGGSRPANNTSLVVSKALFMLGRLGVVRDTVGEDAVCGGEYMPMLKKSQYRMQLLNIVPESEGVAVGNTGSVVGGTPGESADPSGGIPQIDLTDKQEGCCHPLGKSTYFWGEWRNNPSKEDYVYLLWQYVDCCAGLVGG